MIEYLAFEENCRALQQRLEEAALIAGRDPTSIRILPVTKTFPIEAVEYCRRFGFSSVGENRVQEVVGKQGDLRDKIEWELIGHLQTNKAKLVIKHFDRVQSVDSSKLIDKLQRLACEQGKMLPIMLQFNTGEDPNKYGFSSVLADAAVEQVLKCDHLKLEGFMTIAPLDDDPNIARKAFATLRELMDRIKRDFGIDLRELSMGMSGDLENAILEGSTCIRVGSALFGPRPKFGSV